MSSLKTPRQKAVRNWILWGIPIVFIAGGLLHFAFDFSGGNKLVAIFAPVNESPWEHLKMSFWPLLIWWILGFVLLSNKNEISAARWFAACATALYTALIFIISFFYLYTGALGTESLAADIAIFLIGIGVAQLMAYHIFRFARCKEGGLSYSLFFIMLLAVLFVVFTFRPPHIPLFMDRNTGSYGI